MVEISLELLGALDPEFGGCTSLTPLCGGFSDDKKFLLVSKQGNKLLLRTSDISKHAVNVEQHRILSLHRDNGVKCPEPIHVQTHESQGLSILLTSFIEGQDAKRVLPTLSESDQYQIGLDAGSDLRRLHLLPRPAHVSPWKLRKVRKHQWYLEQYADLGLRFEGEKRVRTFVDENISILEMSDDRFQHDDFHVGNLIVHNRRYSGVIDFNRFDWGDPIHEFYKMAWFSTGVSVPFCIGQLDGYFNRAVPEGFWKVYSFYCAMSIFPTLVWTKRYFPKTMGHIRSCLMSLLDAHDCFAQLRPTWYEEGP